MVSLKPQPGFIFPYGLWRFSLFNVVQADPSNATILWL
jgi:hypothetical protein